MSRHRLRSLGRDYLSGTIIDEEEQPLIGGSVIVLGTTQGTSTDMDGSFKFTVHEGEKIQISYLNYKTLTFDVEKNQATQDLGIIKMTPEVIAMEDIVISQSVAIQRMLPTKAHSLTLPTHSLNYNQISQIKKEAISILKCSKS